MTQPYLRRIPLVSATMIAAILVVILVLSAPAMAQAQEQVSISGTVVNGTGGASLSEEVQVLLLISGPDGGLIGTSQSPTTDGGKFRFDQVPSTTDGSYSFSVDYAGMFYGASFTVNDLGEDIQIQVFEPTEDISVVKITTHVQVIAGVDSKNRNISVIEFVGISNQSDRTLLPNLANPQQPSFLRFSLPPMAEDLDLGSDLPQGDIVSIGTGFALTSPVPPGNHSLRFSFNFPYQSDTLSYRQSLPQGATTYQVMIPAQLTSIGVEPLLKIPDIDVDGTLYRIWEGKDIEPGEGLAIQFTNLPQPSLVNRLGTSISDGTFWGIAIPSALGAVLAYLLLFGALKPKPKYSRPATNDADPNELSLPSRQTVIRDIASLDERYQLGEITDSSYQTQREELVSRILHSGEDKTPDEPGGQA